MQFPGWSETAMGDYNREIPQNPLRMPNTIGTDRRTQLNKARRTLNFLSDPNQELRY